jgi:hypothetical protein
VLFRATAAALAALALALTPAAAPAHAAPDGLVAWYPLDQATGATDASGNGRDATVHGAAGWEADGLRFNGTDTYVEMPPDLLRGLTAITVSFDVRVDRAQQGSYFLYGFGNTDPATGYGNGYLFATGDNLRTSASLVNWTGERNTQPSPARPLARGVIRHLVYTQAGTTGVLYEDGVEVGRNTAVTVRPGDIGGGATTANYLGRSLYRNDRLLAGTMRDFRVYDRALSTAEVAGLWDASARRSLALDRDALTLGDTTAVTDDLDLPAAAPNGSALTWRTSDPAVVAADGTVTRPAYGRPDAHVTLTATLARGAATATREFAVTVRADIDDATKVAEARDAISVPGLDDVRGNITLPTTGRHGATITWRSTRPRIIAPDGVVRRPGPRQEAVDLDLIAVVRLGRASAARVFAAHVPPRPRPQPLKGYLFSYFTGEGTASGEQVHFALSRGNDPLRFLEMNGGRPVLTSTLGTRGLRDPFIIRSPEGDKFYQIATDLRIYGNGNWDAAQRTGSRSIMVWESTDLVHWTDQRLVQVSPETAGNTWAPEAFYDKGLGAYVVFWASKIYAADDPGHAGNTHNRMMYATTRDFRTFTEPKVWLDPGYSVIDSTVVEHDGTYHRFTKDERNNTSSTPCSKFVLAEKSATILSPDWTFVAECLGRGTVDRAEGPTVFKSNTEDKWYLFLDEFGGRGYVPFETTDLGGGVWTPSAGAQLPASPRHGTVLPVTQAEYDRLLAAYP